jgi:hypothetical protein
VTDDANESVNQDRLFRLMVSSFVRTFWRPDVFEDTISGLIRDGHRVMRMDAARWSSGADMHQDFAETLNFPDYYGRNLDALNDSLGEAIAEFSTPGGAGLVLAITGYDRFARHSPREAHAVLDIAADLARRALLDGHRLCCLIQSDDPDIRFEPVGAMPVLWNDAEWLNSSRHPEHPR